MEVCMHKCRMYYGQFVQWLCLVRSPFGEGRGPRFVDVFLLVSIEYLSVDFWKQAPTPFRKCMFHPLWWMHETRALRKRMHALQRVISVARALRRWRMACNTHSSQALWAAVHIQVAACALRQTTCVLTAVVALNIGSCEICCVYYVYYPGL